MFDIWTKICWNCNCGVRKKKKKKDFSLIYKRDASQYNIQAEMSNKRNKTHWLIFFLAYMPSFPTPCFWHYHWFIWDSRGERKKSQWTQPHMHRQPSPAQSRNFHYIIDRKTARPGVVVNVAMTNSDKSHLTWNWGI